MSKYLVTGGIGFIGSNLVEALFRQGESVRVLDNCSTGNLSNLDMVIDQIEFIRGDIRDLHIVRKAVKGMDYVFHLAGSCSVARSVDDPILDSEINITGTLNVLTASVHENIKRVVFPSSCSVYGNSSVLPKTEDMRAEPASLYAISKYTGEEYCRAFYSLYGLETVVLRYFNVFGPRQCPDSVYAAVVPIFIKSFLEDNTPTIFGNGEQTRDLVFVEDVVSANLLACHRDNMAGETLNIAGGKPTTINELASTIKELMNSSLRISHAQKRKGDVEHSLADIGKARRLLGFVPKVSLRTGLQKTIDWMRTR